MAAAKRLIRLAVFGYPIAHSLSPAIHSRFARQFGLEIEYQAIASTLEEFPDRLQQFADSGALGCNVTVPLKLAACAAAQELSDAARLAQAVNTLVFRQAGNWYGTNTDGAGLLRDLLRLLPQGLRDKHILLIGAGGAAAGVIGPLLQQAPASLLIANRQVGKAIELTKRFAPFGPVSACALSELPTEKNFDLLINATSLGHQGKAPQLPTGIFAAESLCYDLNYGLAATPWRQVCRAQGAPFSDGLGMLAEQAALAFELWTGQAPDTTPVLDWLRTELS